jgi:hypothetical protein
VRRAQRVHRLPEQRRSLLLGDHALVDERLGVRLAHGRLLLDLLRHERLRVRGLVLLVVTEASVADEIDDEVVPELLAVGESEPRRGERGLRIVGVDVDDGNVEALREIARIARRAALGGIGREADLVVGDDVEGAARRVALDRVQVERLRDHSLAREGRVAVDQDRQRDRGVVDARAVRAIGLLRAREALHDGIDRLEVAGVRGKRHLHLARVRLAGLGGGEVVLHVARAALRVGHEGVDRALALELAQDRGVAPAHDVREDVEPTPMRDADHDLVGAPRGGELDDLVQHRHERVETLDRELLLPDERAAEIGLERFDLREPQEERAALLGRKRLPEAPRLDHAPQPRALGVVGDVLDLVGDRPAVDLPQARQHVRQRRALAVHPDDRGGDLFLDVRRQRHGELGLV